MPTEHEVANYPGVAALRKLDDDIEALLKERGWIHLGKTWHDPKKLKAFCSTWLGGTLFPYQERLGREEMTARSKEIYAQYPYNFSAAERRLLDSSPARAIPTFLTTDEFEFYDDIVASPKPERHEIWLSPWFMTTIAPYTKRLLRGRVVNVAAGPLEVVPMTLLEFETLIAKVQEIIATPSTPKGRADYLRKALKQVKYQRKKFDRPRNLPSTDGTAEQGE